MMNSYRTRGGAAGRAGRGRQGTPFLAKRNRACDAGRIGCWPRAGQRLRPSAGKKAPQAWSSLVSLGEKSKTRIPCLAFQGKKKEQKKSTSPQRGQAREQDRAETKTPTDGKGRCVSSGRASLRLASQVRNAHSLHDFQETRRGPLACSKDGQRRQRSKKARPQSPGEPESKTHPLSPPCAFTCGSALDKVADVMRGVNGWCVLTLKMQQCISHLVSARHSRGPSPPKNRQDDVRRSVLRDHRTTPSRRTWCLGFLCLPLPKRRHMPERD